MLALLLSVPIVVSIHAPTKGATCCVSMSLSWRAVSIHAPTKGATLRHALDCAALAVSIHAPTKGATIDKFVYDIPHEVSIHAPTKGATPVRRPCASRPEGFNPRTHEGCDGAVELEVSVKQVSIHAPTKGATWFSAYGRQVLSFQSTHPRRVRLRWPSGQMIFGQFQSTHPRRVRPGVNNYYGLQILFQSTHPRRVRPLCFTSLIFIYLNYVFRELLLFII